MRTAVLGLIAMAVAVGGGCSSGGGDTGVGGMTGGAGVTGGAGTGGSGTGGTTGAAGAGNTGGGPTCQPDGPSDAAATECTSFAITGPWCEPEPFAQVDGGVTADGGAGGIDSPNGGTLIDGDYELVRYRATSNYRTRRNIRLLNGATRIEWAITQQELSNAPDGGPSGYDSRMVTAISQSGNTLLITELSCGQLQATHYGYTASGTDLLIFSFDANDPERYTNAYTYRRTCRR